MEIQKNNICLRIASVRVKDYLAEYARNVFGSGRGDGTVRIPYTSDLYHLVWELMAKRRADQPMPDDGNLHIVLPQHRRPEEGPCKNVAYYNYLSPEAGRLIERHLKRAFDYDFHQQMLQNEECGRPMQQVEVVCAFILRHGLKSISEDALLQNWKRFRRRWFPKNVRKYEKNYEL